MAWPSAKLPLDPPVSIACYLDGDLVLELDDLGFTLVEGMHIRYVDLAGDEVEHRIGDVYVILEEERHDGGPAGLGALHLQPRIRVELQP